MPANKRGIQRERQVREVLGDDDWLTVRAAGSLGCADVVALREGSRPRLIEVKSTVGPWDHFGPEARLRLSVAARLAGASAELAWWPKQGKLRFIGEEEWPQVRLKGSR